MANVMRTEVRQSQTGAAKSSAAVFLKASVFDFILVLALSVGLTFTVSYGFYGAEGLRDNFLLEAAVTLPLLLVLFAGGWSKRALAPSIVAAVVVCIAIVGACALLQPSGTAFMNGNQLNDVAENYMIWALVLVVCTLACFLLSRRMVGMVFLAVFSILACGTIQFLYRDWFTVHHGLEAAFVVLFSLVALFIYQRYRITAMKTARMNAPAFGRAFVFSAVLGAVSVAAAAAIYFAFIGPAGLGTPVIKPFHDYYKRPVMEYSAPIDKEAKEDPNITSNVTTENEEDTQENTKGGSTTTENQNGSNSKTNASTTKLLSAYEEDNKNEQYDNTGYLLFINTAPFVVLGVVLALLVAVLLRRWWRAHRLAKIRDRSYAYQVVFLYEFLISRFRKLKIECPPTQTPLEFAFASAGVLAPFAANASNLDFVQLTLIYQRAAYGATDITKAEVDAVTNYYRAFFKNARKKLGWGKWCFFKFWTV